MRTHLLLAGVLLTASAVGAAVPAGAQRSDATDHQPPPVAVTAAPTPAPNPDADPGTSPTLPTATPPTATTAAVTLPTRSRLPALDSDYQPGLAGPPPTPTSATPASPGPPSPARVDGETDRAPSPAAATPPTSAIPQGTAPVDAGIAGRTTGTAGAVVLQQTSTDPDDGPAPKTLPATGPSRSAAPLGAALVAAGLSWVAASRRPRAARVGALRTGRVATDRPAAPRRHPAR